MPQMSNNLIIILPIILSSNESLIYINRHLFWICRSEGLNILCMYKQKYKDDFHLDTNIIFALIILRL